MEKQDAVLLGPFVGEFYWECGRFAPLLPYMIHKEFKDRKIKYIILTRKERFDLYGKYADILVPLRIEGDYIDKFPNCFRLNDFTEEEYKKIKLKFYNKYNEKYNIIKHVAPKVSKEQFVNKNQFPVSKMMFSYQPRKENYTLIENYLPKNNKPVVILGPRFRKGFKRNWGNWQEFYDLIAKDRELIKKFTFVICGKSDEYVPDKEDRFLDINKIIVGNSSSLAGLLLVLLEKAFYVCGSQSAIPNMALLYNVEVLEFGCQKRLHTVTYNHFKTPIEFIENRSYNIAAKTLFSKFKKRLIIKEKENGAKE